MRAFCVAVSLFFALISAAEARYPRLGGAGTSAPVGTTYYVSSAASGSGNGLSMGSPWTITQANAGVYNGGDRVLFTGSFSGASINLTTSNWGSSPAPSSSAPVTFDVYGGGATINSGTSNGFVTTNIAGFKIQNIAVVGNVSSSTYGFLIQNTNGGAGKLDYIFINGVNASAYGLGGIAVSGSGASTAGFNHVSVLNSTVSNIGSISGAAGIGVGGINYTSGTTTPTNTNVLISGNTISSSASKAGIAMYASSPGTVEFNSIHDIASPDSAGNDGIILFAQSNALAQFNEVYNIHTLSGLDGEGIDCDGGSVDCLVQYNYTHDNWGCGFLSYAASFATVDNTGNIFRYNISQNDGTSSHSNCTGSMGVAAAGQNNTTLQIYNNTFYPNSTNSSGFANLGTSGTISGIAKNNIIYTQGTVPLINYPNNPGLVFDGNDYFASGTFSLTWNGTNYGSLAAWKSAFPSQETINGGFTANPGLAAAGTGGSGMTNGYQPSLVSGYQLSTSTLKGVGLSVSTPGSQDYFDNVIPNGGGGTGYNVGAYGGT